MKYFLITGRIPATETESARDCRIEIGESNPFDTSGKPFKMAIHESLGVRDVNAWKSLLTIYGTRIEYRFTAKPEGLFLDGLNVPTPPDQLLSLLSDGFVKEPWPGNVILYWKQKGRIEDETGQTLTGAAMMAILENQ